MSRHEDYADYTAVMAAITADYAEYRYYGGRFDFDYWWHRYADDYPEVTA